jgi:hypothetical protein
MYKDMDFPKPLPTGYKEWMGTDYNKQLNSFWVTVDAEFGQFETTSTTSTRETSTSLPSTNNDTSPPAPNGVMRAVVTDRLLLLAKGMIYHL